MPDDRIIESGDLRITEEGDQRIGEDNLSQTLTADVATADGSGTTFTVDNSLYFSDGNRIVAGDTIQLQGQTVRAVITANDWTNNVLTFTPSLTWTNGQGVALAYNGAAPDMGAYESSNRRSTATLIRSGTLRGK